VDDPHWKVLLVGLAQHRALMEKLLAEGHEVEATDIFAEAYLRIATSEYHIIIVDADDDPIGSDTFCKWVAYKRLEAKVIQLTRWRESSGSLQPEHHKN
jgi:nucleoside-diphosphate-sugar epimerase